jgi:hypothetical protein
VGYPDGEPLADKRERHFFTGRPESQLGLVVDDGPGAH